MQAGLEGKCGAGNFSVTSGPNNPIVHFEGAFAATDVPQMTCTKTAGAGTCEITEENDGGPETSVAPTNCGTSCLQIAVDDSGGPNQGVLYLSTTGSQITCCPENPNDNSGGVHVFLPSGEFVGVIHTRSQFNNNVRSCGVAVDDNGDLIVAHGENSPRFSYFDKLDMPDWEASPNLDPPILETIASDFGQPCRTEVDSAGDVFTSAGTGTTSSGQLYKYTADAFEVEPGDGGPYEEPSKVPSQTLAGGSHTDLALDDQGNVLTLNTAEEVQKFSTENGSPIESFETEILTASSIARNNATGTLYVTDRSGSSEAKDVHVFKSVTVPDSMTGDFEPVTATTGVVDGEVDPAGGGEITSCQFEVANNSKYIINKFEEATILPCEPAAPLNSPGEVNAEATGLSLEELHHFRLVTENANGKSVGSIHLFEPHAVIGIETDPATNVAPRSATLHASFDGNGDGTEYFFEWGTNQSYGNTTPVLSAGSPSGDTEVSDVLGGLGLETPYHYRVVMTNSVGTSKGGDQMFTTTPAVMNLATTAASSLDQENITLNGEFTGEGIDTTYYFQYFTQEEYEEQGESYEGEATKETPIESAGVTNGATPVSAEIDQFFGYRTYHYRVVAENSFGVSYGQDETVTAPDPLEPGIENTQMMSVTPTTAMVSAEFNPNHWPTIYLFEWGQTDNYGNAIPFSEPFGGLDNENVKFTQEITGLEPGSIYHFRAVAANFKGTTNGEDVILITPDVPRIDSTLANPVGETTAHLGGSVAPRASSTSVSFQYGTSAAYGATTPTVPIGNDLFPHSVGADIAGLVPGTVYHFRIVATNAIGTVFGPDQTFTTAGSAPGTKPLSRDCSRFGRKAKKLSNRARRLRGKAKQASGKRARVLRRRARSTAKQARQASKQGQACRRGQ